MTRIPNTNYSSSPFIRATDDNDAFDRDDLNLLAQALDLHDHGDTRGLPVARVGTNAVHSAGIQADAVVDSKIGSRTLVQTLAPTDSVGTLTDLLSELANRIKTGFGTTNWFDTPTVTVPNKVSRGGDSMSGQLLIARTGGTFDATLYSTGQLRIVNGGAGDTGFPSIGFENVGEAGIALYVVPESPAGGSPLRLLGSDGQIARILTDRNGGSSSGSNADFLDGFDSGNASGRIPISNGTVNTNLNADMVDGAHAGNASGNVPLSNGTVNSNLNADMVDGAHAGNGNGNVALNNGVGCVNLWADLLDGFHAGNGSAQIPISNGTVNANLNADKLDGFEGSDFLAKAGGTMTGDITFSSGNKIRFPTEVGFKIDLTNVGSVGIGVASATLYLKGDGNIEFRDQADAVRMKLTTGGTPVLTVGGNTVYHTGNAGALTDVSAGSYVGDGGTGGRSASGNIGYTPRYGIVVGGNSDATIEQFLVFSGSASAKDSNSGNVTYSSGVKLGGSDIIVGAGNTDGNVSGKTYYWIAYR